MCITKIGDISLYQCELFKKFPFLVYGFTTRNGGVSQGEYKSLSMSPRRGDDNECVHQNEAILIKNLNLNLKNLTSTKQEHTNNIKIIDEKHVGYGVTKQWDMGVDGIITMLKDVPILCYSADCVPLIFYASDIQAIGAVHAGWRGTYSKIVHSAVDVFNKLGADSKNIYVSIGPYIGQCCYEVSDDVALKFDKEFYIQKSESKYMLDIGRVNVSLLIEKGVPRENISKTDLCTKCNNTLFFSHRGQNGKSGTLAGIICMRK